MSGWNECKSTASLKQNPDKRPSKFAWDTFSVQFEPGLLVLFPSYLFHSVPNKWKW